MATQQVPNQIQGVSQQAVQQRRDTQAESQFDCINSVSDGVAARPGFEVVKVWPGRTLTGAFLSYFKRTGNNYLTGIYGNTPFAINLDTGVDATVTGAEYPNTTGYLNTVGGVAPRDQFRMQAVEDTLFVASRYVAPAMDPSIKSPVLVREALVYFRTAGGAYFKTTVSLSGPATLNAVHDEDETAQLERTISDLLTKLNASGYTATRYGSTIHIIRGAGTVDFNIDVTDAQGDEGIYAIKDLVSGFERLPKRGKNGFKVKVQGEERTLDDDYWVQFSGAGSGGVWQETVAPDTETTINPNTMPHTLVNTGLDTFTWTKKAWSTRIAGDATTTAKNPSFIGKNIRDLFYHKTRLGILLEAGAVWSKARFPYTFLPDTVQTVLATAPVDVTIASDQGTTDLDFTVQVDKTMNLWGQKAQFEVSNGQDNFKQDSISADPTTSYEYAPNARPLSLGKFLYFATEAGPYASVFAIQYQQGKASGEIGVSSHINRYIPSGIRMASGSMSMGMVFFQTDGDPQALYLWNFLFGDNQFLQSAWNKWRLTGGNILWSGIAGQYLYVLQQRTDGVALLRCNLSPKAKDSITGAGYMTRLDYRVRESQVTSLSYNSGTGRTTFTLPYTPTDASAMQVVLAETSGTDYRGKVYPIVSITGAVVVVTGNLSESRKFYVGQRIVAERTESRFMVRTERGVTPLDRLTVLGFRQEMDDTGYSRIEVTRGPETLSYEFKGRSLPGAMLGTPTTGTEVIEAPVNSLNTGCSIRIVNDSFLPSYWQSASYEYEGVGKAGRQ